MQEGCRLGWCYGAAVRWRMGATGVTVGGMDTQGTMPAHDYAVWVVRAAGQVYARRFRDSERARETLVGALRTSYEHGCTVTELAEASGLSRPAVYRAVREVQRQ